MNELSMKKANMREKLREKARREMREKSKLGKKVLLHQRNVVAQK